MNKKIEGEYEVKYGNFTYLFKDLEFDADNVDGFYLRGTFELKERNKKGEFSINFGREDIDNGDFYIDNYEPDTDEEIYEVLGKLYGQFKITTNVKQKGKDIIVQMKMHHDD